MWVKSQQNPPEWYVLFYFILFAKRTMEALINYLISSGKALVKYCACLYFKLKYKFMAWCIWFHDLLPTFLKINWPIRHEDFTFFLFLGSSVSLIFLLYSLLGLKNMANSLSANKSFWRDIYISEVVSWFCF